MKKILLIIGILIFVVSCDKKTEIKEVKTAYVDTSKLLDEYTEAKDVQAKFKTKSEEMGRQLEIEIKSFKADAAYFQKNAQANGQAWAQQNGQALQEREQKIQYAQQGMSQQLQREMGVEMDTLVSGVKKFIKTYGKEKGYTYIYGTGESANILYAEDKFDITKEIVKLLNDKYEVAPKVEAKKVDAATETKK
jgi:outer membrane protein